MASAHAAVRIKDVADIKGLRENQIVGYGLVIGLNGTGDTLRNAPFTEQSLQSMLDNMGINIVRGTTRNAGSTARPTTLRTRNVAAVMVTADLPPSISAGERMDITVSSLGDATSLLGGILVMTPLRAADGAVYAVGQGAVTVAGYSVQGQAQTVRSRERRPPAAFPMVRWSSVRCGDLSTKWNSSCSNSGTPISSPRRKILDAINRICRRSLSGPDRLLSATTGPSCCRSPPTSARFAFSLKSAN